MITSCASLGCKPSVLQRILAPDCTLAVWQRPSLPIADAHFLGGKSRRMPATQEELPAVVARLFEACTADSRERLMAQTIDDCRRLMELTGADSLRLRLEPVPDDGCRLFHVDRVALRMISTLHGDGSEWLDEHQLDRRHLGCGSNACVLRHGQPQRLETGWLALMKGECWPGNEGRGLVHRSPPHVGVVRLVFVADVTLPG